MAQKHHNYWLRSTDFWQIRMDRFTVKQKYCIQIFTANLFWKENSAEEDETERSRCNMIAKSPRFFNKTNSGFRCMKKLVVYGKAAKLSTRVLFSTVMVRMLLK
jgi:hypothetical protein